MTVAPAEAFVVADVQERREWDCAVHGNQPLTASPRHALAHLGFAAPGPHVNPWREAAPDRSRELAVLMERALVAVYGPPLDFEIALYAGNAEDSLAQMDALMPSLEAI